MFRAVVNDEPLSPRLRHQIVLMLFSVVSGAAGVLPHLSGNRLDAYDHRVHVESNPRRGELLLNAIRRLFQKPAPLSPKEAAAREASAMLAWWLLGFSDAGYALSVNTNLHLRTLEMHTDGMSSTHSCAELVNFLVGDLIAAASPEDRAAVLALIRSPGHTEAMLSQPNGEIVMPLDVGGLEMLSLLNDDRTRAAMCEKLRARREASGLTGAALMLYAAIHHVTDRMQLALSRERTEAMEYLYSRLFVEIRNSLLGLSADERHKEHFLTAIDDAYLNSQVDDSSEDLDDLLEEPLDKAGDDGLSQRQ